MKNNFLQLFNLCFPFKFYNQNSCLHSFYFGKVVNSSWKTLVEQYCWNKSPTFFEKGILYKFQNYLKNNYDL